MAWSMDLFDGAEGVQLEDAPAVLDRFAEGLREEMASPPEEWPFPDVRAHSREDLHMSYRDLYREEAWLVDSGAIEVDHEAPDVPGRPRKVWRWAPGWTARRLFEWLWAEDPELAEAVATYVALRLVRD